MFFISLDSDSDIDAPGYTDDNQAWLKPVVKSKQKNQQNKKAAKKIQKV